MLEHVEAGIGEVRDIILPMAVGLFLGFVIIAASGFFMSTPGQIEPGRIIEIVPKIIITSDRNPR